MADVVAEPLVRITIRAQGIQGFAGTAQEHANGQRARVSRTKGWGVLYHPEMLRRNRGPGCAIS